MNEDKVIEKVHWYILSCKFTFSSYTNYSYKIEYNTVDLYNQYCNIAIKDNIKKTNQLLEEMNMK